MDKWNNSYFGSQIDILLCPDEGHRVTEMRWP